MLEVLPGLRLAGPVNWVQTIVPLQDGGDGGGGGPGCRRPT